MEIKVFTSNDEYKTNAFLIINSKKAILVDCPDYSGEIIDFLEQEELDLRYVLLTNSHFNHFKGLEKIKEKYPQIKTVMRQKDIIGLYDQWVNLSAASGEDFVFKRELKDIISVSKDSLINLVGIEFKILIVGSNPISSVVYKMTKKNIIFSGDLVYLNRVANPWSKITFWKKSKVKKAIKYIYNNFDNKSLVYPGHGEFGFTLEDVKKNNLQANKLANYKSN